MMLTVGVTPALAINIVNPFDCTIDFFGKREYFTLVINNPIRPGASPLCFANAGQKNVYQTNVTSWYAGNNMGIFAYNPPGSSETRYWFFGKGDRGDFAFGTVVRAVGIA